MAKLWILSRAGFSTLTTTVTPGEAYCTSLSVATRKPKLSLFSGAMPSSIDPSSVFSRTNELISYELNSDTQLTAAADGRDITLAQARDTIDLLLRQENTTVAKATGTATWFMLWSAWNSAANAATDVPSNHIFGTVGAIGSGADLELNALSFVKDAEYFLQDVRVKVARRVQVP